MMEAKLVYRSPHSTDENVSETMEFANAIMQAIEGVCHARDAAGKQLDLVAIVGALANAMAHFIGGVPDPEHRISYFHSLGTQLAEMIELCAAQGTCVETYSKKDIQ